MKVKDLESLASLINVILMENPSAAIAPIDEAAASKVLAPFAAYFEVLPTPSPLEVRVAEQRRWMTECGGDINGYLKNYGSRTDPDHFGDGGEAIYAADLSELRKLELVK